MNTSVKTLIGFLLLLAVALAYAFMNWPRQARLPSVAETEISTGVSGTSGSLRSGPGVSGVGQAFEETESLVNRNIFAPLFDHPSQAPLPDINAIQSGGVAAMPVEILPPPRPMPIFLGKLRHAGQQKVFLSVEGEVYVVGPGDSFGPDNTYRLVEILSQSLIVRHQEDKENLEIEAAEQPISVLSASGASNVETMTPDDQREMNVPVEPGRLDKEVPIDNVVDE